MRSGTLTVAQAAKLVGEITQQRSPHVSCIRRWILRGARGNKLPATQAGGRFFIERVDLIRFLQQPATSKPAARPQSATDAAISGLLGTAWGSSKQPAGAACALANAPGTAKASAGS